MDTANWISIIIPILGNGIIIFILQKMFEKKQKTESIKNEYFASLRNKIDISLALHAKGSRTSNLCDTQSDDFNDEMNNIVSNFFNSCLDVYYYYVENEIIFDIIKANCEKLVQLLIEISQCPKNTPEGLDLIGTKINEIREVLLKIKLDSMK